MTLEAGTVLPATLLNSGWFHLLAIFVGVNTLIYAAIGLAKLIPRRGTDAAIVPRATDFRSAPSAAGGRTADDAVARAAKVSGTGDQKST